MRTYLNSEVSEIVQIPKRQVIAWTEKGLVKPDTEARGAGHKRLYSYVNLIEFRLCRRLLYTSFDVHSVKDLLAELRKEDSLKDWALDFLRYLQKAGDRGLIPDSLAVDQVEEQERFRVVVNTSDNRRPGYLVWVPFGFAGVVPCTLNHTLQLGRVKEIINFHGNIVIVDLAKIKAELDDRL